MLVPSHIAPGQQRLQVPTDKIDDTGDKSQLVSREIGVREACISCGRKSIGYIHAIAGDHRKAGLPTPRVGCLQVH